MPQPSTPVTPIVFHYDPWANNIYELYDAIEVHVEEPVDDQVDDQVDNQVDEKVGETVNKKVEESVAQPVDQCVDQPETEGKNYRKKSDQNKI